MSNKKNGNGIFTISLDFELYWGVRDKKSIDNYRENLLGVSSAIPEILNLFDEYQIHATWACVGFLFFENLDQMLQELPTKEPDYVNQMLSPYNYIKEQLIEKNEIEQYHYAPSLIKLILSYPNQEVGTHTFSHYYCLENGSDIDTFRLDIEAARRIAEKYNVDLKSLVFPRNQTQVEYLSILEKNGIIAYRGNEKSWIYSANSDKANTPLKRILRLLDAYFNISGTNCYPLGEAVLDELPFNIRSSRFLRPYSKQLKLLEPLRLRRILSDLSYAAKNESVYHLWWHPHNFGVNLDQNLSFLQKILEHYKFLQESYGMESLNMQEIANKLLQQKS